MYKLSKSAKKYECPSCHLKTFTYYEDDSGNILDKTCGRCDREAKCGYHLAPKQFFTEHPEYKQSTNNNTVTMNQQIADTSYMDMRLVDSSAKKYESNIFVQWLIETVGLTKAMDAVNLYRVGTSSHWDGATVFWQIDGNKRLHSGKIMLYDATGHRVKQPQSMVTFAHTLMNRDHTDNFHYKACLFGEHLISEHADMTICYVESEKTAVVASTFFPDYIWVACGGKDSFKPSVNMSGRKVVVFPDCKCSADWMKKAEGWNGLRSIKFSTLLDEYASEEDYEEGVDIADYLIKDEAFAPKLQAELEELTRPDESFAKYEIDITKVVDKPHTNLQWNNMMLFTAGNIEVITGAAKSRKSFLSVLLTAEYLKQNPDGSVLYFDTEQAEWDAQMVVSRIYDCAGIDKSQNDPRIHAFRLCEEDHIKDIVISAIEYYKSPFIVIDGTADLVSDINDQVACNAVVAELKKYASMYNSTIINVVHQNRNDDNTRGWLGSILEKKCEAVLLVKSNGETSHVTDKFNRHLCPVDFEFGVTLHEEDETGRTIKRGGLPYIVVDGAAGQSEEPMTSKQRKMHDCILLMEDDKLYTLTLLESLWHSVVASRTADGYIKTAVSEGRILMEEYNGVKYYKRPAGGAELALSPA